MASLFEFGRRMVARGQHDDPARIGSRCFGGGLNPALQVFDCIDDAAAEFEIARPGTVDAVFLERADGKTNEARGLRCAQVARWQACWNGGQGITP